MRVFISSTFYDLIDIRSELFELFRSLGISPVLSDEKLSNFELSFDRNSIETCLINVENSDAFVVILDQRYGPTLGDFGFEDISATHLEYRHAKGLRKPIYFYVRDRLEADFSIWRKNKEDEKLDFTWAKDKELFDFLSEHRQLEAGSNNTNWYLTFTDVRDLKEALTQEFESQIKPQLVAEAINQNRFPSFDIDVEFDSIIINNTSTFQVNVKVTNLGGAPAFNFYAHWPEIPNQYERKKIVAPNQSVKLTLLGPHADLEKNLLVEYNSFLGVHVCDTYTVSALIQRGQQKTFIGGAVLSNRSFKHAPPIAIDIEEP